ncbi:MAG: hypothetical protein RLZZ584_2767 [Pseudomonadota bacterium]|jgi:hypothetical protein
MLSMRIAAVMAGTLLACGLGACGFLPVNVSTNDVDPLAVASQALPEPAASAQASFRVRAVRHAGPCDGESPVVDDPKRQKDALVLMALSGGGSRAALFSAQVMLEMQKMQLGIDGKASNLLHEVDAISSVSGGSLPAAYYAISHDPHQPCAGMSRRVWDEPTVTELMTNNYLGRWFGNLFWPGNVLQFWLTAFDRTDIMAQTLSDNLYDKVPGGVDLTMAQLNPLRPNLILNATVGSRSDDARLPFGSIFTFTAEDFGRIASSIDSYSVGRAVMATATFPGAFNFMTLCDYAWKKSEYRSRSCRDRDDPRYLHLFDGGNADNLGLTSLKRVIWSTLDKGEQPHLPRSKLVVLVVDSFIDSRGASPQVANPRGALDYLIDTNFIDATDVLLESNRRRLIHEFDRGNLFPFGAGTGTGTGAEAGGDGSSSSVASDAECRSLLAPFGDEEKDHYCAKPASWWQAVNRDIQSRLVFRHLSFGAVGELQAEPQPAAERVKDSLFLRNQLLGIPTSFKLRSQVDAQTGLDDAGAILCATPHLFGRADDVPACAGIKPAMPRMAGTWDQVRCALQTPGQPCGLVPPR